MAINPTNIKNNFILGTPIDELGLNVDLNFQKILFQQAQNPPKSTADVLYDMAKKQFDLGQYGLVRNMLHSYGLKTETVVDYPEIEILYIKALIGEKKEGAALERLKFFLTIYPNDVEAKSLVLKIYSAEGWVEAAESISREILDKDPLHLQALSVVLYSLKERDEWDEILGLTRGVINHVKKRHEIDLIIQSRNPFISESVLREPVLKEPVLGELGAVSFPSDMQILYLTLSFHLEALVYANRYQEAFVFIEEAKGMNGFFNSTVIAFIYKKLTFYLNTVLDSKFYLNTVLGSEDAPKSVNELIAEDSHVTNLTFTNQLKGQNSQIGDVIALIKKIKADFNI